jgi:hypothetical protein
MSNWEIVSEWLVTDAGAGWIVGILGLSATMYGQITKRRPTIVVCKEAGKFSLIEIDKKVKENIQVKYKSLDIENLSQIELELFNNGAKTIKNFKMDILFDKGTKILDVVTGKTTDITGKWTSKHNSLNLELPYLNSYSGHHTKLTVKILCDGTINSLEISGGGEGWSLKHKKLPTKKILKVRFALVSLLLLLEILASGLLNKSFFKFQKSDIVIMPLLVATYIFGFMWALPTLRSKRIFNIVNIFGNTTD